MCDDLDQFMGGTQFLVMVSSRFSSTRATSVQAAASCGVVFGGKFGQLVRVAGGDFARVQPALGQPLPS